MQISKSNFFQAKGFIWMSLRVLWSLKWNHDISLTIGTHDTIIIKTVEQFSRSKQSNESGLVLLTVFRLSARDGLTRADGRCDWAARRCGRPAERRRRWAEETPWAGSPSCAAARCAKSVRPAVWSTHSARPGTRWKGRRCRPPLTWTKSSTKERFLVEPHVCNSMRKNEITVFLKDHHLILI